MSKQQNQYVLSNLTDPLVVMKHSSSQIQALSQIQSSRVVKIKSNPNYINSEVFQQYISSQQSYSKLTARVPKFLKKSFISTKKKPSYIQTQKIKIQHHLEQMLIEDSQPSLKKKLSQEERFQIQGELKKVRSLKSQSSIQQSFKMFVPVMHKCQLCQNQSPETKISICRCEHKFCQICLQSYLIYNINNIADDIKCPEESCYQKFDQNCKLFKSLPQKMKKKYIKNKLWRRTLRESDIRLCPREQCQEGLIDLKLKPPICQKCGKTFCKQCELQSHQGPCEQNFQLLHQEWKRCPQCRVFIQKNEGCNHMTCKCAHQFCYICLSKWDNIHYACGNPENQQMVNLLQLPNFDMQQLQQMMMNNRLQLQNLQRQLEQFQNRREQIERETFLLGPVLRNFDEPIISDMRRCRRTVTALTFIILLPLLLTLMLISLAMGIVIGWVFLTLSIIPFAIKYSYCPTGSDLKFIALFPIRTMSQVYRFYVKYIIRCGFNQSTQ